MLILLQYEPTRFYPITWRDMELASTQINSTDPNAFSTQNILTFKTLYSIRDERTANSLKMKTRANYCSNKKVRLIAYKSE